MVHYIKTIESQRLGLIHYPDDTGNPLCALVFCTVFEEMTIFPNEEQDQS